MAKILNSVEGELFVTFYYIFILIVCNQKSINQKMETIHPTVLRKDNQLLVITHLSQLLTYVTGFGGLIVPLILWLTSKDKVLGMDEHGKQIINFQLSLILLTILSIPAILLLGLGILALIVIGVMAFVMPIVNAVRASNNEAPSQIMTIQFIK